MKTLLWLPVLLVVANTNFFGSGNPKQETAGLYSSLKDFLQHKLTFRIDCTDRENKLKLNQFFGGSTGYVISNGEKHEFNKNEVYGYQSCENKNYRFYKNSIYQIMDTAGFYIYYQYRSEEINKGKGLVKVDEYFFSRKGDDQLQLLTIANLKAAFPANSRFHYSLDNLCRTDRDLIAYDNLQHMYKIQYLYTLSVN
jgi:hypothetical protein